MHGPEIVARSISQLRIPDKFGNVWQYHSRSDRHSKIACWSIMFDLLVHCSLLRQHIADNKVGFGINHELRDFRTGRTKNLDLVVCTPNPAADEETADGRKTGITNFVDLAQQCEVLLDSKEQEKLASLPPLRTTPVGSVCIALEAKAVMTEHIKALPRLHDELDSSHLTVHGHADHAIAAGLVTINFSGEFSSTDRNKYDLATHQRHISKHDQPKATVRTIAKVREIRRRSLQTEQGFDALGIMLVDFKNDGSPLTIVRTPPAPSSSDDFHYDRLIERICSLYRSKFQGL